jgi:hypothetical protein
MSVDPVLVRDILDGFAAPIVGRGVWYVNHCLIAAVINHDESDGITVEEFIEVVYVLFMVYCRFLYCNNCREHALEFIETNPIQPTDPEDVFAWLYDFHRNANEHAGKTSPDYKNVIEYFVNRKSTTIRNEDYDYELIQAGFWHYFFIIATKSKSRSQLSYIYYVLLRFTEYLPREQRILFREYVREHQFCEALYDTQVRDEFVCISFFDWLYGAYELLNSKTRIYPIGVLRQVYMNMGVCDKDCDQAK